MTLFEDDYLLAVAKPAGMVVHPTYRNQTGTLLQALISPGLPRPSIVGRLDKWTSGVVVVAKTAAVHAAMQRTLASPDTVKTYLALTAVRVDEPSGRIDLPLRVDLHDRRRVIVAADGAASLTTFHRLAVFDRHATPVSLLRCHPTTGRRHQIRAHLAARGWPILGDPVYGDRTEISTGHDALDTAIRRLGGQALHASGLTFLHPFSRQNIELKAPLPDIFDLLLTLLSYQVIL